MSHAGSRSRKRSIVRDEAAKSGSGLRGDIRLALNLAQTPVSKSTTWILCPWLARFPKGIGLWLSILAAHDANQGLLDSLPTPGRSWPNVFAAVLAVDPLRSPAHLIQRLKASGIPGVINFPSVSFIDGQAGTTFDELSLGIDREIEFLRACHAEGLRIAGVTNSVEAARKLVSIGADFLLIHGGAPTRDSKDPSKDVAIYIMDAAGARNIPVVPISRIVPT